MALCIHCGVSLSHNEVQPGGVCQFCTSFVDDGFVPDRYQDSYPYQDGDLASVVLQALRSYQDNDPSGHEERKRPSQIQINKDDVNDVLKMNGFVKDVLDVAAKQFAPGSAERRAVMTLFDQMNGFNEGILEKAKRMESGHRTTPILFSKMESESYFHLLDLAHKLYGKFILAWFKTKAKKDWPEWRRIFYENAWHLGSFCRYGHPAKSPSPWILGQREPLDDDPFGTVPIGEEKPQ